MYYLVKPSLNNKEHLASGVKSTVVEYKVKSDALKIDNTKE